MKKKILQLSNLTLNALSFFLKLFFLKKEIINIDPKDFDPEFYLKIYNDVSLSGMNPLTHYVKYGLRENRLCQRPSLKIYQTQKATIPDTETILVVSHDASISGCPILSLNICEELNKKFNVIIFLLGEGTLIENFKDSVHFIIGPYPEYKENRVMLYFFLKDLLLNHKIKFSIVNSLASRNILQPLRENFVPTVLLANEFFPLLIDEHQFYDALLWSGSIIFPAKIVQQNATTELNKLSISKTYVFHQGRSSCSNKDPSPNLPSREQQIYSEILHKKKKLGAFLVLGAGTVEYRKGVDLFISTAQEIQRTTPENSIILLWIGHIYHYNEFSYAAYLRHQLIQTNLLESFYLIEGTNQLEKWYDLMDLFFLSSRLDPFPNVAIDAMCRGIPVVCFDKASGICEFLQQSSELSGCIIEPMSSYYASQKIINFSQDKKFYTNTSNIIKKLAKEKFNMIDYVDKLLSISSKLCVYQQQAKYDYETLMASTDFNINFFLNPNVHFSRSEAVHRYICSWHNKIYFRRPMPGFIPEIYSRLNNLDLTPFEPFAHYIHSGKPIGPWQETILTAKHSFVLQHNSLKTALHIHVLYIDMLEKIIHLIESNQSSIDFLISTDTLKKAEEIKQLFSTKNLNFTITIVPNNGRDIGPFLTTYAKKILDYDVIGHIHTKKSPDIKDRIVIEHWNNFLLENLVGGKYNMIDQILDNFNNNSNLGLVYPSDPNFVGWTKNRSFADILSKKLGIEKYLPEEIYSFPVGTMFWARPQALKPLFDLKLTFDDYPEEALPYDGSILHALERMIPVIIASQNYTHSVTYVPGVTR